VPPDGVSIGSFLMSWRLVRVLGVLQTATLYVFPPP
jgi:hypothetical protein